MELPFNITYNVQGEHFIVQCRQEQVDAALAEIRTYVGFQEIVSVVQSDRWSHVIETWYPMEVR